MEPGSWCQAQPQRPIEGMGRLSHCGPLCEVTIVSLSSWGEMHILTIFIIYLIEQKNFSEEMGLCCLQPLNSWCPGKSSLDRLKDFLPQVEVTHRTARGLCGDHGGQFTATPFPAPSHRSQGNFISCVLAVHPRLLGQSHTVLSEGLPGKDEPPGGCVPHSCEGDSSSLRVEGSTSRGQTRSAEGMATVCPGAAPEGPPL